MRINKILSITLCSSIVVCGTILFTGCNNGNRTEESLKESAVSQSSELSSEVTESSTVDDVSIAEESGKQDSVVSSSEEFTEEELKAMDETDEKLEALTKTDEYKNGNAEDRKKLAEEALYELAENGFVVKDSIYVSDDMITFTYKGGALGGIQLTELDPYMNDGIKNPQTDTSGKNESSLSDVSDISEISDVSSATEESYSEPAIDDKNIVLTSEFELTDSQKKLIGKKKFNDFEKTANKSNDNAKGLFKNYFTGKTNLSETHCRIYAYGSFMMSNNSFSASYTDFQKSDNKVYMKNSIKISDTDDYIADEDYIFKDGKIYALYTKEKMYTVYEGDGESQIQTVTGLGEAVGKIKESGTCELDGKDMYYEILVDDQGIKTVAYFDDDKFYEAEVYKDISENGGDELVLLGYLYASFDLDIDDGLYEIPKDYNDKNAQPTIDAG